MALTVALALACLLDGGADPLELRYYLLAGALAASGGVFIHAALSFSVRFAVLLFAISFVVSLTLESSGVHFGFPFGAGYAYHSSLTPAFASGVPLFIPLCWFALSYGPLVLLRGFAPDWRGAPWTRHLAKAMLCAVALAAFDLYLDPLAVAVGAWEWEGGGAYFGVPWTNYLGWVGTGLAIYVPVVAFGLHTRPAQRGSRDHIDRLFATMGLVLQALAMVGAVRATGSFLPVLLALAVKALFLRPWANLLLHRESSPAAGCGGGTCAR